MRKLQTVIGRSASPASKNTFSRQNALQVDCGREHPHFQEHLQTARGRHLQLRTEVLRDQVSLQEVPHHGQQAHTLLHRPPPRVEEQVSHQYRQRVT